SGVPLLRSPRMRGASRKRFFSAFIEALQTPSNCGSNQMIGRDILQLSLAASVGVALFSVSAAAQQITLKQQLVGTWTFVRTEARQPDKPMILPFGENPKGVNIFTEDGHFVQIQIADGIPKYASNSRVTGTSEENKATVQGSLALFGTYTVDEAGK